MLHIAKPDTEWVVTEYYVTYNSFALDLKGTPISPFPWGNFFLCWSLSPIQLFVTPPGSSVHGILQARILERVGIYFSRGPSQPRQ